MTVIINKVRDPWGSLGNMSNHPIEFDLQVWPRSEHLFQAMRLNCLEAREEIRAIKNPMAAKMRAKKIMKDHPEKVAIPLLGPHDLANMRGALRIKLEQHEDVKALLEATGDREIVEDATRRQRGSGLFWGAALQDDGTWEGQNWLGKLWMELRAEMF